MKQAAIMRDHVNLDDTHSREKEGLATKQRRKARLSKEARTQYRRRTIELHPEIDGILDRLQDRLMLKSQTEVIQKALQILAIVAGDGLKQKPQVFLSREDGKLQEILIL